MANIFNKTQATSVDQGDAGIYVGINRTTTPVDRWMTPGDFHKARTGNRSVLEWAGDLAAAVSAIGSSQATLEIPVSCAVTADLVSPSNITLLPIGTGVISVSSGKTLTINGAVQAGIRQIFSGSGSVRFGARCTVSFPEWFGAAMDNSTDDAVAVQKAIDVFPQSNKPHAGGDVFITGGCVIASTLTVQKNSIRIIGRGWGVTSESPYGGFIRWNGSAGSPMVLIEDCWNSGIENIRLIGKSTAKPTAAIEFRRSISATTQMNHSYARNIWIGAMGGFDSDSAIQFDAGIVFSGTIDGDTNLLQAVVISQCTIGIDCQNGNASITHFDTLKITSCGTGIKCNTFILGHNWNFGGNTLDMNILGDKHINVVDFTTEGATQYATLGISAQLFIKHGGFQITNSITTNVIDATNPGGSVIVLEDCRFALSGYTGSIWKIKARNTGGAYKGYLRIINCIGISADNLDVATSGGGLTDLREVIINRPPGGPYDWGTNSHVYLTNSATLEENRYDFASKVNIFGGPLAITQIAAPTGLAATPIGGSGTTYGYRVSAVSGSGESLAASTATCSGGATLSPSVYNMVRWEPVLGASAYKVYGRTSGSELLLATISASKIFGMADGSQVTSFKDDGSLTPSGALPTVNTTGGASVAGIFNGGKGADVASAATISPTGNLFHVTGTTNITGVSGTGIAAGTEITIIFDGALTFTDGSNLKLAGNFVTTADDTIKLTWDGSNWYEVCRSVN